MLWGPGDRESLLSIKFEYWLSNKTTGKLPYDQQPEFRGLSEFYTIIFLNQIKLVENTAEI